MSCRRGYPTDMEQRAWTMCTNTRMSGVFHLYREGLYHRGDYKEGISADRESRHVFAIPPSPGRWVVRAKHLGRRTYEGASPQREAQICSDVENFHDFICICRQWCREVAALSSYPTGEAPRYAAYKAVTIPGFLLRSTFKYPEIQYDDFKPWFDIMIYPDGRISPEELGAHVDGTSADPASAVFGFICSGPWETCSGKYVLGNVAEGRLWPKECDDSRKISMLLSIMLCSSSITAMWA